MILQSSILWSLTRLGWESSLASSVPCTVKAGPFFDGDFCDFRNIFFLAVGTPSASSL